MVRRSANVAASLVALAALLVPLASCSKGGASAHETLSSWSLFSALAAQTPRDGVLAYDVNSTLWADHAVKFRFMSVPTGEHITYDDSADWAFPEGTVFVKTFAMPRDLRDPSAGSDLVETRLLVNEGGVFTPYVYVWNDADTDATLLEEGAHVPVSWLDSMGVTQSLMYRVPNVNQCKNCHGGSGPVHPLGPRTRQLDRDRVYASGTENQLEHFAALGLFDHAPSPAGMRPRMLPPLGDGPVADRARSYLDANCAHCHRAGGQAASSGLWLGFDETDPVHLGVCKMPVAAGAGTGGFGQDIVPGDPDHSVLVFRFDSTDPGIRMPQLPSQLVDPDGLALLREWISEMTPAGCH